MSIVICRVVRHGAERKRILVHVPRIAQHREYKISASNVVCQVAEERTAIRVVAQILDNRSAVRIRLPTVDLFCRGIRESLPYRRLDVRLPHHVDDRLVRGHRIRFRFLRVYQKQSQHRHQRKRFSEPAHNSQFSIHSPCLSTKPQ